MDAVKELHRIPDDSEVLVPAVTWVTNVTSVIQAKLRPVFVDVNLTDFSFNYDELEEKITDKTRIILVTHLMGIPADTRRLQDIAERHRLILLEDCCESHGATRGGVKVGNFGLASTFSFYWGHHITTIEGGMVCTNDTALYNLLVLKRSHGLARELDVEQHADIKAQYPDIDFNFLFLTTGYNVRNTELHAVIGTSQLSRLDDYIKTRNDNYDGFLNAIEGMRDKLYLPPREGISSFCLPFVFKTTGHRDFYKEKMLQHDIEVRPIIGGNLLRHPCFKEYGFYLDYVNAEIIHQCGFYIGNNQFVNNSRIDSLKDFLYDKS
jgi:CDP-6-deoxy-D-xylo-4-hexulose-3-dehydrase